MNIKTLDSTELFETQAVRLFRTLEFQVLSGRLQPGKRLVRRVIAKSHSVSQATVAEALWRLETEGLAESAPMYGTRVAQITMDRVKDEMVMREALECEVARLAAKNIKSSDVPRLKEMADQVDTLLRSAGTYSPKDMEVHQEFHISLARLTQSRLLLRELERVWRRHFMFFSWVSESVWPSPIHWHRSLLDAIATQDPDVAERSMREHVLYGSNHQMEVIEKIQKDKEEILRLEADKESE